MSQFHPPRLRASRRLLQRPRQPQTGRHRLFPLQRLRNLSSIIFQWMPSARATSPRNPKVDGRPILNQPGKITSRPGVSHQLPSPSSSEFTRPAKSNSLHRRIREVRDATVIGANHRTNTAGLSGTVTTGLITAANHRNHVKLSLNRKFPNADTHSYFKRGLYVTAESATIWVAEFPCAP